MNKDKIKSVFYSQQNQSKAKLEKAKFKKDDEYYTPYNTVDFIFKKIIKDKVKDKIIYCNCDSEESNFVKYLKEHKDEINYKELLYTSDDYKNHFDLMNYCDIIITNPPFSIFKKEYFPDILNTGKQFFLISPKTIFTSVKFLKLIYIDKSISVIDTNHLKYNNISIEKYIHENNFEEIGTIFITNIDGIKNRRFTSDGKEIFSKELTFKYDDIPHDIIDNDDRNILNINLSHMIPKDYSGYLSLPTTSLFLYLDKLDILEIPKDKLTINGKNLFTRVIAKLKEPCV